jgi:heme-degrading monooxygenase HmoA
MPRLAAAAFAALLGGCTIATPYREASPTAGGEPGAVVVVALTEATLGPDKAARAAFWDGVRAVQRDLPNQQGLLGHALRRELLGNRAWTMTVWESEAALDRFVASPAHRAAMRAGNPALAGQRFATVMRPRAAGPMPWAEALDVLAREGQSYR